MIQILYHRKNEAKTMKWQELQEKLIYLTKRNILNVDFAKALNITRQSITFKMKSNVNVRADEKIKVAEYFKIPIEELKEQETSISETTVPVLGEVYASMGNGVTVYNENQTGTYSISNQLAKELGVNLKYATMIFASGDSMMPTIYGGDSLLVDTSKTEIYDGRIYCVRINGQLYAKRLQLIPPDKIKVVSDNQEKYDPFYVEKDSTFDFEVIGEIRWWGRVAK